MKQPYIHIFTLVLMLFACPVYANAISAESILQSAAEKYRKAQSLSASFIIEANGNKTDGSIIVAKDKFRLSMPQMSIWYNGRTQWTYSPATQEVSITEPSAEELQQINPFAIVSSFRQSYKSTLLKSSAGTHKVSLVPINNDGAIKSIILSIDAKTSYPKEINITTDSNSTVKIIVSNVTSGKKLPLSRFTFNPKEYPDAEVIDLR